MLSAAVLLTACGCAAPVSGGESVLARPTLPEPPAYPDESAYLTSDGEVKEEFYDAFTIWAEYARDRRARGAGTAEGLEDTFADLLRACLTGAENRAISPLNLYLALGMLSEVTDGESRAQLLSLLRMEDIEAVRQRAAALWDANYQDDGATVSRLAASFWLADGMPYTRKTLDTLAEIYRASSHQGVMGSDELNAALRSWLNEQTGGLLEESAERLSTRPETALVLCATIYFRARWSSEFSPNATAPETFHGPAGDVTADFMRQSGSRTYFWGERFSAVAQPLENGGAMWLVRPDEGVTPEELLSDEEAMAFLLSPGRTGTENRFLTVNLAVPKFDVSSDLDLLPVLNALGVTDVMDPARADFSPLTPAHDEMFLSGARHAARVVIDEEGCLAAAYTVMLAAGSSEPPAETVDFVLDRPFLFVVTGEDNVPLFAGTVYTPA